MAVKYHGKNGVVYASVSGGVAAVLLGGMRGFTLDASTDLVDVTEFAAGNRTFVQGFPNYTGTLDGFWASDVTILQSASSAVDGTNIYLYPTNAAPSKYIGGPAWLNYSIRSAIDQAVGETANFSARAAWVNNL